MWKRLTALLFILILGGQVWAGVCGCFDGGAPRMKCCKRDKLKKDTISKKPCCDSVCGTPTNDLQSRFQSETAFKLPAIAEVPLIAFSFRPRTILFRPQPVRANRIDWPAQFSRPPNLYIKNQSFLI